MVESYETTTLRMAPAAPCALIQDLLPLYLEGEVSTASGDLIVEHLARCERCSGFLAGAQSVRGQLAIERRARFSAGMAAQPERGAVLRWRAALASMAAFIICLIGGMASGLLGAGEEPAIIAALMGAGALGALLMLARVLGPLTARRLGKLATSVGTGVLAGVVIGGAGSSGGGDGIVVAGMLLGLVATGMVCFQLAREAGRPAPAA
jgi:predicted anti-sigma-YlaC factor YlaD